MRYVLAVALGIMIGIGGTYIYLNMVSGRTAGKEAAQVQLKEVEKPLEKYSIENLGKREYKPGYFEMVQKTDESRDYVAYSFLFDSDGKNVSGLAYLPAGPVKCPEAGCPVIVQARGYAEPAGYESGYGTYRSAREFAKAGFITLAPDFLGFGQSASPSADVFEARFETYTTFLNLLADVGEVSGADPQKVGIWGHSNGGHIALTVLEISRKNYPTTLWAPVSAGFPYSILYYMGDNSESDALLRKKLADFEQTYDAGDYSLVNFLDRINAPIQLHQGTADKSVPVDWSRSLVSKLKKMKKEINYHEYPGADHNLVPDWDTVVGRDIMFFREKLGLTE